MMVPEVALTGLTLGLLQGLGVDHTCSFFPIMTTSFKKNIILGSTWGIAHSFGVLLVLSAIFFLKRLTPFVYPFAVADLLYACVLIVIGSFSLWKFHFRSSCHAHDHHVHHEDDLEADEITRLSLLHNKNLPDAGEISDRQQITIAASAGFFHGISGCGCVVAAVPLLAVSAGSTMAFYASSLVIGAVVSSAALAAAFSVIVQSPENLRTVNAAGGALAVGVGVFFAIHSRQHRGEVL
jgi:hypothetical protein